MMSMSCGRRFETVATPPYSHDDAGAGAAERDECCVQPDNGGAPAMTTSSMRRITRIDIALRTGTWTTRSTDMLTPAQQEC